MLVFLKKNSCTFLTYTSCTFECATNSYTVNIQSHLKSDFEVLVNAKKEKTEN